MAPPNPTERLPRPLGRRDAAGALALGLALLALYLGPSDLLPGADATGNVYTAATLLSTGSPAISPSLVPILFEWRDQRPGGRAHWLTDLAAPVDGVPAAALVAAGALRPAPTYYLVRAARDDPASGEARYVNAYGPGTAATVLPLLLPLRLAAGDLLRRPALLWAGARFAAAFLTAAAAALLFLAARRWLHPTPAAGLALLFALGTPAWSQASQTLWQHPADLFHLSLGLLAVTRLERTGSAALAGFAFGAAAACRPQSAVFAVVCFAWLLGTDRRRALAFAAGSLPPVVGLVAWNWWWLGGPLRFGQVGMGQAAAFAKTGVASAWPFRLGESLPGLLLSPSRGALVFAPHLVLAAGGAVLAWRRPGYAALRPLTAAAALLLLLEAGWFDWWGGWSYGWRRLLGLAPALTLFLIPLAPWLAAARWRRVLLGVLAAWAVALQGLGALTYDLYGWNGRRAWEVLLPSGAPARLLDAAAADAAVRGGAQVRRVVDLDVDHPANRGRLWSLSDSQVVYLLEDPAARRRSRRDRAAAWVASYGPP